MKNLTTEARRHGEESEDRVIGRSGDRSEAPTCVILSGAPRKIFPQWADGRGVEGPLHSINSRSSVKAFSREIYTRVKARLRNFFGIVLATLREIFDESAYERFLSRTHAPRSVASYRDFRCEREASLAHKPRCC